MKPALCDLALPTVDCHALLPGIRALGFQGIEVAPHRIDPDGRAEGTPSAATVEAHRRTIEAAGLTVTGLHALLAGRPDLGLFGDAETVRRTRDHLVRLSAVCRDLGGRTMILGAGGRRRGALPLKAAWLAGRAFLEDLLRRIERHGTVLCIAPLGPSGGDFVLSAADARILVDALDHPSLGLQMNSAALVDSGETGHAPFNAGRGRLEQFGVCDPGLTVPDPAGPGRHADFRRHLATIGYGGWLTLKQRPTAAPFDGVRRGWAVMRDVYLRQDGHAFVQPHRPRSFAQRISPPASAG
ncbi:sugar phosphate isomerase/epimerase [Azospirillum brasilense]|uniref:Sugar phosphate isomerase/epimerase n=1 Tax=Azospirillum brasilense TaxID=192 RepID=A0A560BC63_AZOBR|nr:TIM barrel protein [Azospirillum brasilense]TWA70173.1 sugar phosphate isomerase/epimerase [Azospirillum brasilense]